MVLLELPERLLAHDDQILVLLHLAADSVDRSKIFRDFTVDQRHEKGFPDVFESIDSFLIVVDIDKSHHHALIIHFLDRQARGSVIDQKQRIEFALFGFLIQHCIGRNKVRHIQFFDPGHKAVAFALHLDPDLLVVLGKALPPNGREDRRDRAAVIGILLHSARESVVHPLDLAGII